MLKEMTDYELLCYVFDNYVYTGECTIKVDNVCELIKSNRNWFVAQWHNEYRLVNLTESFKATINIYQALELIIKLKMIPTKSTIFNNAQTWSYES